MKNIIIIFIVLVLIGFGIYFFIKGASDNTPPVVVENQQGTTTETSGAQNGTNVPAQDKTQTVIGKSVEGRDITAYHFGEGARKILFVGGLHGGYEWNTSLLAYEMMDYLKANPSAIPASVAVIVIPVLNPDGLYKVVGTTGPFTEGDVASSQDVQVSGRFNANNVDLGRNFDCNWQKDGVWQTKTVSGGSEVFSEPESRAIRDFVTSYKPDAVVVWYSAAGGVYASSCGGGILPETNTLTNLYATASGYTANKSFDFYKITGDMVDWLAKMNIPAISVLLSTHTDIEWDKNLAGIKAVLDHYGK